MIEFPWTVENVTRVAANMREWDRREIFATQWEDDPKDLAEECFAMHPFSWCFGLDEPIAVIGAWPLWSGVWTMWCFGTDRFGQIGLPLTRFARRVILPSLYEEGAHRLQCESMVGHDDAHLWLNYLGAQIEGRLHAYGRGREDFLRFVWTRADIKRRLSAWRPQDVRRWKEVQEQEGQQARQAAGAAG